VDQPDPKRADGSYAGQGRPCNFEPILRQVLGRDREGARAAAYIDRSLRCVGGRLDRSDRSGEVVGDVGGLTVRGDRDGIGPAADLDRRAGAVVRRADGVMVPESDWRSNSLFDSPLRGELAGRRAVDRPGAAGCCIPIPVGHVPIPASTSTSKNRVICAAPATGGEVTSARTESIGGEEPPFPVTHRDSRCVAMTCDIRRSAVEAWRTGAAH
jgi:hypothetical protein